MTAVMKKQPESLIGRGKASMMNDGDAKEKAFPIIFTERAKCQLASLLSNRDCLGIRIKVLRGGCFGSKYAIEYVKKQEKFDKIIAMSYQDQPINIFVDPKAMLRVLGITVDYIVNKFGSGFEFINSKEKGRCGCGKSFH